MITGSVGRRVVVLGWWSQAVARGQERLGCAVVVVSSFPVPVMPAVAVPASPHAPVVGRHGKQMRGC